MEQLHVNWSTEEWSPRDAAVVAGVREFDRLHGCESPRQRLSLSLEHDTAVIGGLIGILDWGWLCVEWLWVKPELRRRRLGTRLMARAEEEAHARGCHAAYLSTMDFQARPFYEKLGYRPFGALDQHPIGHCLYFLQKRLDA